MSVQKKCGLLRCPHVVVSFGSVVAVWFVESFHQFRDQYLQSLRVLFLACRCAKLLPVAFGDRHHGLVSARQNALARGRGGARVALAVQVQAACHGDPTEQTPAPQCVSAPPLGRRTGPWPGRSGKSCIPLAQCSRSGSSIELFEVQNSAYVPLVPVKVQPSFCLIYANVVRTERCKRAMSKV